MVYEKLLKQDDGSYMPKPTPHIKHCDINFFSGSSNMKLLMYQGAVVSGKKGKIWIYYDHSIKILSIFTV